MSAAKVRVDSSDCAVAPANTINAGVGILLDKLGEAQDLVSNIAHLLYGDDASDGIPYPSDVAGQVEAANQRANDLVNRLHGIWSRL